MSEADRNDLCASFQTAVTDILARKSRAAVANAGPITAFAVAGGVAANQMIRSALQKVADDHDLPFAAPPLALCTDNGAMIAYAALTALERGRADDLSLAARPRWPLDQGAAPMLGSGKKGAKA